MTTPAPTSEPRAVEDACFLSPACGCTGACFARRVCDEARLRRLTPTPPAGDTFEVVGVLGLAFLVGMALAHAYEVLR